MSNGLPPLPVTVSVFSSAALLVADAIAAFFGIFPQEWGIFLDGVPVVVSDNVVTMEFRKDYRISKYPQESGAFASYNKVAEPYSAKFRFSTGGSVSERQAMLDSISAISGDTEVYDIVTPEAVYASCNVVHFDYRRAADNAGLLVVDVWVEEVRTVGEATFSNTKSPGEASRVDGGVVQGQAVTRGPALEDVK